MPRPLPLLLTCALLAGAPPAEASTLLERQAVHLVAIDYHAFLLVKAKAPPPFDWSTDGCTKTPRAWALTFSEPCEQHDFGYRNLGRGLRLQRTEDTRLWVDRRLLTETRRVCAERRRGARRTLCDGRARAIYAAVRWFNAPWD